ncbi:hypothetical protein N0V88_001729 [Collariella sp. IMI 366227]|nr:hypothetical protein N0V88_001729 [Collariella sp. IMI 366227]
MSPNQISPLLRAWYKWKMLRLDLNGNTYWEFLDRGASLPPTSSITNHTPPVRWRRIVRYPGRAHPSDVNVPPAWHQWLRHTRSDPPSIAEQQAEVARRARMQVLAAQADARWEAKPRVMEGPTRTGTAGMLGVRSREPALDTERRVGPGSATEEKGAVEEVVAGGEATSKSMGSTDEVALGDQGAVNQREESWQRIQQEAEAKGRKEEEVPNPWKQTRGGPSEKWQPQAWEPAARSKK